MDHLPVLLCLYISRVAESYGCWKSVSAGQKVFGYN